MEKSTAAFLAGLKKAEEEVSAMAATGEISREEAHGVLEHIHSLRKDIGEEMGMGIYEEIGNDIPRNSVAGSRA